MRACAECARQGGETPSLRGPGIRGACIQGFGPKKTENWRLVALRRVNFQSRENIYFRQNVREIHTKQFVIHFPYIITSKSNIDIRELLLLQLKKIINDKLSVLLLLYDFFQ